MKKEEYVQLQSKLLRHLFDAAKRVPFSELQKLIDKPESETRYHLEEMSARDEVNHQPIIGGGKAVDAYVITTKGRKQIMET
jgi:hypothetical protein